MKRIQGFEESRGQVILKKKLNFEQGISNYEVFGFTLRHLPAVFVAGSIPCSIFCGSIW
jgi:hypothetical protein